MNRSDLMGKIKEIAIREKIRAPMELIKAANVDIKTGIDGDIRGGTLKRQVTLLTAEAWRAVCQDLQVELPWTVRRANILVEGIELPQTSGYRIEIGEILLEVTRQTDPCSRMDEQHMGLTKTLMPDWRGGVCCNVIQGGKIAIGDNVLLAT